MPSLIAIAKKMTVETYRIAFRASVLSAGSFIFNIKLTNGTISNILKIVIRLAQLSFIDTYLVIMSEVKNLSAKCYTLSHELVTIAVTFFNSNGDYVKEKTAIWQEID
jgi:hypothetical protein